MLILLACLLAGCAADRNEENTFRKYPRISQIMKLFLYAILDNFGYRQLNTIYKVEAMAGYRKNKSSWGSIQRRTFSAGEKK
ncbi:MAG: hypothetical protein K5981_01650 [Clostridia bacterium]|nr:hypothetical protein [Clostridia bacterium]